MITKLRPMEELRSETAGDLLWIYFRVDDPSEREAPLHFDPMAGDVFRTIGHLNGEGELHVVGWDWNGDEFFDTRPEHCGVPIGFCPFDPSYVGEIVVDPMEAPND